MISHIQNLIYSTNEPFHRKENHGHGEGGGGGSGMDWESGVSRCIWSVNTVPPNNLVQHGASWLWVWSDPPATLKGEGPIKIFRKRHGIYNPASKMFPLLLFPFWKIIAATKIPPQLYTPWQSKRNKMRGQKSEGTHRTNWSSICMLNALQLILY